MRIRAVLLVAIAAAGACAGSTGTVAGPVRDETAIPDAALGEAAADPGSDAAAAVADVAPANVIEALQKSVASIECPASPVRRSFETGLQTDAVVTSPRFAAEKTLKGSVPGYFVASTGLATATPWNGVVVTVPEAGAPGFQPGDVIRVTGDHVESYCLTELVATGVARVGSAAVPAPLLIGHLSLDNGATNVAVAAEPLEGVLVEVDDVDVLEPNADAESGTDAGCFEVTGSLIVCNDFGLAWMSPGTDGRTRGQHFRRIVGVVTQSCGRYVLMPRSEDDLGFGTADGPEGVADVAADLAAADVPDASADAAQAPVDAEQAPGAPGRRSARNR